MGIVRGEYWIVDGEVWDADGDTGDRNHESYAIEEIFGKFAEKVFDLADELGVEHDNEDIDFEDSEINQKVVYLLYEIQKKLKLNGITATKNYILTNLQTTKEILDVLLNRGDPTFCVMKYDGWIAVRANYIDVYGFDYKKRQSLVHGLEEILNIENVEDQDISEEEFAIHDRNSGRSIYVTMDELKEPQIVRSQQPHIGKGDRRFSWQTKDSEENKDQQNQGNKPVSPWKIGMQNAKMMPPGHDLWRGTSEAFSFKEWLQNPGI